MRRASIVFLAAGALSAQAVRITAGPVVEYAGTDSAVIAWSTNGQSTTVLQYGTTQPGFANQVQGLESAGTHRVTLTGLAPGTTYYIRAISSESQSPVVSFTTKGTPPVPRGPQLWVGPVLQDVTDKSARLWWYPPIDGVSRVQFGARRNRLDHEAKVEESSALLNHLQPETVYHYSLPNGLGSGYFTTEPKDYRNDGRLFITAGPVIEFLNDDGIVIAWSTNTPSGSLVRYSEDMNNLNKTAAAPWGQPTHRITIKGLKPDTTYFFLVESAQASGSGTMAKSNISRFHTLPRGAEPLRNIVPPDRPNGQQ